MGGSIRPQVVEVGTLPWEVVLARYWPGRGHHLGGARLVFLGSDMGCDCFFWFFEMGVVLASASFWTALLPPGPLVAGKQLADVLAGLSLSAFFVANFWFDWGFKSNFTFAALKHLF